MIANAFVLGLVLAILGFGAFFTFKILNIPDLTVDASFTFGAAICVMCVTYITPSLLGSIVGLVLGFIGGFLTGLITGLLHTKLKIDPILAGILTLTGFYSINLFVTGKDPNIGIAKTIDTIFINNNNPMVYFSGTVFSINTNQIYNFLILLFIVIAIALTIAMFFKTKTGLSLRACGDNEIMVHSLSMNVNKLKILGFMICNGLVALSGALFMELERSYDSGFGNGMMVIGLCSIIIGEAVLHHNHNMIIMFFSIVIGSIIYRLIYAFVLYIGWSSTDMKLLTALAIILFMVLSRIKRKRKRKLTSQGDLPYAKYN